MSQTQGQMSQGPMPWNPKTVKPTEREDSMCRRKVDTGGQVSQGTEAQWEEDAKFWR